MEKENLIQLTNNLYKLTLLFPKKEPLRYRIRELADEILADLTLCLTSGVKHFNPSSKYTENRSRNVLPRHILEKLEILDSFFEVAKVQNWTSPTEILNLQQEYIKVREELKNFGLKISSENKTIRENYIKDSPRAIPARQEKILTLLKEKEKLQVQDLKGFFPELSKRTLRRDFEQLFKKGLVARLGEKNSTYYQIKKS